MGTEHSSMPIFLLHSSSMYYIVGLGNPGTKYKNTRHNVGFLLLEHFVNELHLPSLYNSSRYCGRVSHAVFSEKEITILLPETFVNDSGNAVQKLVPTKESEHLVVVYDDIDIPLGEIKVSYGKGDGGHNGIKSIIEKLGTRDFVRVRVGIASRSVWTGKLKRPKGKAMASYVLGTFTSKDEKRLSQVQDTLQEIIELFVTHGREKVMNMYN